MSDEAATTRIRELMPYCATLGVRAEKYTASEVALALDWAPGLCTSNGVLHGGVIMSLADAAGGRVRAAQPAG